MAAITDRTGCRPERRRQVAYFAAREKTMLTTARERSCTAKVTDPSHQVMSGWWPSPGHGIGWGDRIIHALHGLLVVIARGRPVRLHGADFDDDRRCAEACDPIRHPANRAMGETIASRP